MTLDLHDQVSATRTATHAAAKRARKTAHHTADVAHAIDLHEPAQAAKAVAKRTAEKAAKATGRAAGRRSKRAGRRGLRVIVLAAIGGGLMVLAFTAFRRMSAGSSATSANADFDRLDSTGSLRDAEPEAHSEAGGNGTAPESLAAKPTLPSAH